MVRIAWLIVLILILAACDPAAEPKMTPTATVTSSPTPTDVPPTAAPTSAAPAAAVDLCFGLAEADCDLINRASENTLALRSANLAFTLDVTVGGLEPLALILPVPLDIVVQMAGGGPVIFGGDPPVEAQLNGEGTVTTDGETMPVMLPLIFVDRYLYIPQDEEWVGIPITEDVPLDAIQLAPNLSLGLLPFDPVALVNNPELTSMGALLDLEALGQTLNPSGTSLAPFAMYERLSPEADETLTPFRFTLDVRELLNSPEFSQALQAIIGAMGSSMDDPTMALGLQLLPMLLPTVESEMVITQYVNADEVVERVTFVMDFSIDLTALMGSAASPDIETEPIQIRVDFDLRFSDLNGDLVAAAPEGARLLTPEEVPALFATPAPTATPEK